MSRGADRHYDPGLTKAIDAALAAVPHSAWVAIRYGPERSVVEIAARPRRAGDKIEGIALAEDGFHLKPPLDPVMTTRASLGPYVHGLSLVCSDQTGIAALIVVLRDEALGRFTEGDRAGLRPAGASIAGYLASQPQAAPEPTRSRIRARTQPAMFTLNENYEIESAWAPPEESHEGKPAHGARRLAPSLEAAVRQLSEGWDPANPRTLRAGSTLEGAYVIRAVPLSGKAGLRIGVTIEPLRTRDRLAPAAQFRLSARELDVLAQLLEGRDTREVAAVLKIAATTASDHVKRMLLKTGSRNRVELVARALGWPRQAPPSAGESKPNGLGDERGA